MMNIDNTHVTLNEEAGQALKTTSNQSSEPYKTAQYPQQSDRCPSKGVPMNITNNPHLPREICDFVVCTNKPQQPKEICDFVVGTNNPQQSDRCPSKGVPVNVTNNPQQPREICDLVVGTNM